MEVSLTHPIFKSDICPALNPSSQLLGRTPRVFRQGTAASNSPRTVGCARMTWCATVRFKPLGEISIDSSILGDAARIRWGIWVYDG